MLQHIRRIASIGEVMIEMMADDHDNARLSVAGDTYNTAVYLRRLLPREQLAVSYVTALGDDDFSDRIITAMTSEGIATGCVERREGQTCGLYAIHNDASGERTFTYWRGQSAARSLFAPPCHITLETLRDFDLLYLSGITLAVIEPHVREMLIAFLADYRAAGGKVAFDSNYRPRLWSSATEARLITQQVWTACCDIAIPSLDDELILFGDASAEATLARLRGYGMASGALKRGRDGPVLLRSAGKNADYPPAPFPVDSTAAGDSFNAGFLAALIRGETEEEAAMAGHRIASDVVSRKGAIIDVLGTGSP